MSKYAKTKVNETTAELPMCDMTPNAPKHTNKTQDLSWSKSFKCFLTLVKISF